MSLPHAILGLLNYKPMTGYDLKKFFNDSIEFFWSAQISQIYRELKKLESEGHVVSEKTAGMRGPDRIVYRVTKQGTAHLRNWLADTPEKIDEDNRNAFLLRVMLLSNLGIAETHFQILKRLKKYQRDMKELQSAKNKLEHYMNLTGRPDLLLFWKITLSRGFHDVRSHIEWAEESLKELEKAMGKNNLE